MVLGEKWLKRGPVSPAILYLLLGLLLGPEFLNVINYNILDHPKVIEVGAEIVVIISLFSAGLKLQSPLTHLHWKLSTILASLTMVLTVALLALTGHYIFDLPWGAAILLGGILAPTDPVLASEVQVKSEKDRDRIRSTLTGEAGLNDGTAFPVIMLGLTIIGGRWSESETSIWKWFSVDFLWAIPVGLVIGFMCGWVAAKFIVWIHAKRDEKLVIEDFVSIGLIGASYGLAHVLSSYGFLAVFAAGLAFARVENQHFSQKANSVEKKDFSPALMRFSTQLERIGEVTIVVFLGFIATRLDWSYTTLILPTILILVIRPLTVLSTLAFVMPLRETLIVSWFGIRGIGSIYYLAYALNHGFGETESSTSVFNLILVTIVVSIFVHGISASPIMKFYERRSS